MNKGECCGYGWTYCPDKMCKIATVPIGYADGFARAYRGADVIIYNSQGEKYNAHIVGRICMDQLMLDVTNTPCGVGDEVVFFGDNPEQLTTLAKLAKTIDYEILCLISSRVPRINVPNRIMWKERN
jgi:alanine racemase